MSKKTDAIGPRIRQAPHRVHQRAHRLDGLMAQRIGARRCFWPHNRGDKTSSGTAAFAKPAGSHAQQSTTGEVLRETDIFLREAVAAVQKQDTRKRSRATWSCHGRDQTAYVWNGYSIIGLQSLSVPAGASATETIGFGPIKAGLTARPATTSRADRWLKSSSLAARPDGSACRDSPGLRSTGGSACGRSGVRGMTRRHAIMEWHSAVTTRLTLCVGRYAFKFARSRRGRDANQRERLKSRAKRERHEMLCPYFGPHRLGSLTHAARRPACVRGTASPSRERRLP